MARGQHDDRNRRLLSNLATDIDARHIRQAEVEHDEIGSRVGRGVDASHSIGCFVDAGGDIAQCIAHGASDLGLVVYDEDEIGIRHDRMRVGVGRTTPDHAIKVAGHIRPRRMIHNS